MEFVIIRAPLVFGPGNGANFLRLLRALHAGIPLPVADSGARRGLMYVDNLVEVIRLCLSTAAARNELFLAADDNVEIRDLARRLAAVLDCPARLWRCLNMPLVVDSSHLRHVLKWKPGISLDAALEQTGHWFLSEYLAGGRT